jgi:hypothetical protein
VTLPPFPEITSIECIAALQKLGFHITTVSDKLVALQRDARVVVVPRHQVLDGAKLLLIATRASVSVETLEALAHAGRRSSGENRIDLDDALARSRAARAPRGGRTS